jgi:2-oxoglutarate ferredoxin oxidoreductase subunit alpha
VPGTPGLEHRVGGIEKADGTGDISYDPANHEAMVRLRARRVAGIARSIPALAVDDPGAAAGEPAPLLVLGWGSTFGAITAAVRRARVRGLAVAQAHLVHLNPFPANLGDVVRCYPRLLVPETNLGQLSRLVRSDFLVDAVALTKVAGTPFRVGEIEQAIVELSATAGHSEEAGE